jgi:outer membrane protein assembly factor BamB
VDAATGVPRWQVGDFEPLPGDTGIRWLGSFSDMGPRLVDRDGGLAVLTGYDAVDEQGLALLSAADGSVLWHTPLRKPMSAEVFELRAVDDRVAVTTNRTGDTVAVAVRTGKRLWTRPATDAKAIAGDVVLVQGWEPSPSPTGKLLSQVTALDLSTGAVRWDLTDRYDGSEALAGGEDTAQVRVGSGGKEAGKLLATGDGHELADADGEGRCASADGLLACPGADGVVVRDLATGAVTETGVSASRVDRVQDGRFYLARDDRVWTIDAEGNVIDKRLPGELTTITDEMVCFTLTRSYSVACYARG